ncbi:DUF2267 domain-containing protein [Nonomuraea sp. 10N515B]|uniref:DUF2267 domain-containing protein n=1 Tax=Nonomuraea sp. 10N515B TaxID=3457422 RepID=UPI003FCD8F36
MDYEQFVKIVGRRIGQSAESADRAVEATLQTLSERLSKEQSHDLMGEVPPEAMRLLSTEDAPEPFDADEFLHRVAGREGVDLETADRHARAVFWALGQTVSPDEIAYLAADLSPDFAPLLEEARRRHIDIVPAGRFLDAVARRAALDRAGAHRATEAVLETLAERITPGEVEDLISRLPVQLHAPLKRGVTARATRMPVEEFVRRIAERENVPPQAAREHALAVFTTLRESIPSEEFSDLTALLPSEYASLLPRS